MSSRALALTLVICFIHTCVGKLALPSASFEAISPRGFRVSIPDIEGITLFGFHGSLFPTRSPQVGMWARDVTKPTDGRWTYTNLDAKLNVGDKIYFWTYIIYDGAGYRNEYGEWTVMATGQLEEEKYMDKEEIPKNKKKALKPLTSSSIDKADIVKPDTINTIQESKPSSIADAEFIKPETIPTPEALYPSSKANFGKQPPKSPPVPQCQKTDSEVRNMDMICSGQLLFESDFKTLSTFDKMWKPEVVFGDEPDYPFVVYLNGSHISLENGHLTIKPILLEEMYGKGFIRKSLELPGCTVKSEEKGKSRLCKREAVGGRILPPVISGKITTMDTFNFRYGRVEVRAKLSKGNWILSDILLEPSDNKYGSSNYLSGIMKIASARGNPKYDEELVGGAIINHKLPFRTHGLRVHKRQDSWTNDFHNFTLVWETERISLYVDGENYGDIGEDAESFYDYGIRERIEDAEKWKDGTKIAPFDEMFFISLGVRAGGIIDFEEEETKPWKNLSEKDLVNFWKSRNMWEPTWSNAGMQVESVRVYAL